MDQHIAKTAVIGQYCVIEDGVTIGENTVIGHHAVIHEGTVIGSGVRVDDFACLGKRPMRASESAVTAETALAPCVIGDGCIVGTGAVIYRGCTLNEQVLAADFATLRERVSVGAHTIVGRGVCVECDCTVGAYCKIETGAYITAYSRIGDRAFIAPGVVTSNDNAAGRGADRFAHFKGVTVEAGGRIGAGAVILPGKTIGSQGMAAAGSVITRDVPERTVAAGVPARFLRPVPPEQLLPPSLLQTKEESE